MTTFDIEANAELAANPRPITLEQARAMFRDLSLARRDTRRAMEGWLFTQANAEFEAKLAYATAYATKREADGTAKDAEIAGKRAAALWEKRAARADAMAKSCKAKLEQLEGDRAGVNKLADMSLSRNWGDG